MKKILVVDDDKEIVKAIEIYLLGEKYNVLNQYPEKADELKAIMKEAHIEDSNWPLFR